MKSALYALAATFALGAFALWVTRGSFENIMIGQLFAIFFALMAIGCPGRHTGVQ
jgi:hypothetical protein